MSSGLGKWQDPTMWGDIALWANATNHALYKKYHADKQPVLSDTDGDVIIPGGGIAYCSTAAEIKTACEDAGVGWVLILEGTYAIPATIAPTSYTSIIGIGYVRLDWSGAADGEMFSNAAATDVTYEHIYWVRSGNFYNIAILRDYDRIIDCDIYYDTIKVFGDSVRIVRSQLGAIVRLYDAQDCRLDHCIGDSQFRLWITTQTGYASDKRFTAHRCHFAPIILWSGQCVYFVLNSGTGTIRNVKFDHCTFEPHDNTKPCIEVQNNANLTVEDVSFNHCTFLDALNAYNIPALPTVARWRFTQNEYEASVATRYGFTDPGDFHYTNDGD